MELLLEIRRSKSIIKDSRNIEIIKNTKIKEEVLYLAFLQFLHKCVTYLKGEVVICLTEYAQKMEKLALTILNAAMYQMIPALERRVYGKLDQHQTYKMFYLCKICYS